MIPGWILAVIACIAQISTLIIDREAREIMYLVASLRLSVRLSVRQSTLSQLNRLTYDLDIWYVA